MTNKYDFLKITSCCGRITSEDNCNCGKTRDYFNAGDVFPSNNKNVTLKSLNNKIKFECKSCGNCCRNKRTVDLNPLDVIRMSNALKIKPSEFVDRYCTGILKKDGNIAIPRLVMIMNPDCKFLDDNNQCSVYNNRPTACRLYPIGVFNQINNNTLFYEVSKKCLGFLSKKRRSIQDYTNEGDLNDNLKLQEHWSKFLLLLGGVSDQLKTSEFLDAYFKILFKFDLVENDLRTEFSDFSDDPLTKAHQIIYFAEKHLITTAIAKSQNTNKN